MYTSQTRSTCLVFRETDIRKCFMHENQKYPPALSSSVKLKQGVRSSWIPRDSGIFSCHENTLHVEVTVLNGVVHISGNRKPSPNMKRSYSSHVCFWNWVNPTRGSRLVCIHEGQSETCNEGKQRDRNMQASV